MGTVNSFPVVSQAKSLVVAAGGDFRGALRVQSDFIHEFPGLSQLVSVVYFCVGQFERALWTQRRFLRGMSRLIDGYPFLGHLKGLVHYVRGAKESARNSVQSSTRSTILMMAAVYGAEVSTAYAIVCTVLAGYFCDAFLSRLNGRPFGLWQVVEAAGRNPTPSTVSDVFIAIFADVFTGVTIAFPQYFYDLFVPFVAQNVASPSEYANESAYEKPFSRSYY